MSSAKNELCNNNNRGNCNLYEKKQPASVLQISKVNTDYYNKYKLERSTDSRLPLFNKPRRVHNCVDLNICNTPTACKNPSLILKRKSVSLVELTSPKMSIWASKKWVSKEHVNAEFKVRDIVKKDVEVSSLGCNETELARRVCKMFILNAWRHRNAQVSSMKNKLTKMGNEVDNLNIQVVVLRNLLESEKLRVSVAMSDAAHLQLRLETELKEKSHLKNEISSLELEITNWKRHEEKIVPELHKLKDELTLTSEQNKYLRRECDDFVKTVSEAKQKESQLQGQLIETNASLKEKSERLNEVLGKYATLLARMSELKIRNQSLKKENEMKDRKTNEYINKINDMSVALNNSQNICKVQNENIVNLKKDLIVVEEKLRGQTEEIINLTKTVVEYKTETEEFQKTVTNIRNRIIFGAIKIAASLFFPYNPHSIIL